MLGEGDKNVKMRTSLDSTSGVIMKRHILKGAGSHGEEFLDAGCSYVRSMGALGSTKDLGVTSCTMTTSLGLGGDYLLKICVRQWALCGSAKKKKKGQTDIVK
jgi:hypothetical protein